LAYFQASFILLQTSKGRHSWSAEEMIPKACLGLKYGALEVISEVSYIVVTAIPRSISASR
jgi:hypothetical protein